MNNSEVLNNVLDAIVYGVGAAGEFGASGGILYAGLMGSLGIDLDTFNSIMNILVKQDRLRKEGHVYYVV